MKQLLKSRPFAGSWDIKLLAIEERAQENGQPGSLCEEVMGTTSPSVTPSPRRHISLSSSVFSLELQPPTQSVLLSHDICVLTLAARVKSGRQNTRLLGQWGEAQLSNESSVTHKEASKLIKC